MLLYSFFFFSFPVKHWMYLSLVPWKRTVLDDTCICPKNVGAVKRTVSRLTLTF